MRAWLTKVWDWLGKHCWLVFIAVGAIFLGGRGRSWWRTVKEESKYIDVSIGTKKLLEQHKYDEAINHVKLAYQDKIGKLEDEHRAMVSHLETDPEQLAAYLASIHI